MLYRAFVEEDDDNAIHRIEYYHNPLRWQDNALPKNDPIRDIAAWSNEIKYLDTTNTDISDEYINNFWSIFAQTFPEVKEYLEADPINAAGKFRDNETGGNIIFRPVTLLQMIKAIVYILSEDRTSTIGGILRAFCNINRSVSSDLWNKIIWNPSSKTMLVNNQLLLKYLFVYIYDPGILKEKHINDFYQRYILVKNIDGNNIDAHLDAVINNA